MTYYCNKNGVLALTLTVVLIGSQEWKEEQPQRCPDQLVEFNR